VALPHCQWFGSRQGFALEFDSLGPVGNRLLTQGDAFGLRPKNPVDSVLSTELMVLLIGKPFVSQNCRTSSSTVG